MRFDFPDQIQYLSKEELIEIFLNSSEYQPEFIELVKEQLVKEGIDLSVYTMEASQKHNLLVSQYEIGIPGNNIYIILGFIGSLLGGVVGIVFGYIYSEARHTKFGKSYYVFDQNTRSMGVAMIAIGIFAVIIGFALRYTE